MKTLAVILAIATSAGYAEVAPAQDLDQPAFYIVTRAATAEARALFSARLVRLKAANLHWYAEANVVRAEISADAIAELKTDPDVVLTLTDQSAPSSTPPAGPTLSPMSPMQPPPPPVSMPMMGPPAMGGMMMPGIGMGMAGPVGLMDAVAGMFATKLINRAPSCRIVVSKTVSAFAAAGGDEMINVKSSGSCAWQAQSNVPWIRIDSGSGVSGSGVVSYSVTASEGKRRAGSIFIVGVPGGSPLKGSATIVITQALKSEATAGTPPPASSMVARNPAAPADLPR